MPITSVEELREEATRQTAPKEEGKVKNLSELKEAARNPSSEDRPRTKQAEVDYDVLVAAQEIIDDPDRWDLAMGIAKSKEDAMARVRDIEKAYDDKNGKGEFRLRQLRNKIYTTHGEA